MPRQRLRAKRSSKKSARRAPAVLRTTSEDSVHDLLDLSADWYWEQDSSFRFTRIEGRGGIEGQDTDTANLLGKPRWEIGLHVQTEGSWESHRALLDAHQSFRDVIMYRELADGVRRYISVSGKPLFNAKGDFIGYRGIGNDITARKRDETELTRMRVFLDGSPDMMYITDRQTMRFVYVNETACRLTSHTREDFLKIGPAEVLRMPREDVERALDETISAGPEGTIREHKSITADGVRTVVESRRRALKLDGRWLIFTRSQDISLRKRAEQAAARMTNMFAALSATNEAIMRATSPDELYQRVCDAAVEGGKFLATAILQPSLDAGTAMIVAINGMTMQELGSAKISLDDKTPEGRGVVGTAFRTCMACVSNDFLKDARTALWHERAQQMGIAAAAAIPLRRNGQAIGVLLFYSREKRAFDEEIVKLLDRMAENVVFALDNFAHEEQRRRAEERIQYLATHDGLTGLPNRVMFSQVLTLAIESAKRYDRRFAVMFIDLDRFKVINDSLGHEAGDKLLQETAIRLRHALRASDVVARLGGDEFVVLVNEVTELAQVTAVARKIISAIMKPLDLMGQECRVTASVGICLYPTDADDEQSLMKHADMAMYLAKEEGKNNFQFYSKDMKARSIERMAIETRLRRALDHNELSLHYQAKIDVKTGKISGVEALLRWNNPDLGNVSPMQFIPVAEESGLIVPIGRWVLHTACAQNVAWQRQGLAPVCIAVNLSARQFVDEGLFHDIKSALTDTGMAPELLELEITEGMVMQNPERSTQLLASIKQLGVRLAIDDFGTGYSSLAQIKRFPIDTLKVDRSFIREIPSDTEDRAITEAIIAMGKTLSLTVVAEGVETKEQATFLREHACDEMQGYYFSKPVPSDQFAALLQNQATDLPF